MPMRPPSTRILSSSIHDLEMESFHSEVGAKKKADPWTGLEAFLLGWSALRPGYFAMDFLAAATTLSAVIPKFSKQVLQGPDEPKPFIPTNSPLKPSHLYQP